jgi:hypothetical protein
MQYCECGNKLKFINGDVGYSKKCSECTRKINLINISKNKRELLNSLSNVHCGKCKREVKIKVSALYQFKTKKYICEECKQEEKEDKKLSQHLKADKKRYKDLIVQIENELKVTYNCEVCNKVFIYSSKYPSVFKKDFSRFCEEHRFKCKNCNKYCEGNVCDKQCLKEWKKKIYLKNYGVDHNFKIPGTRPNDKKYWLKRGFTELESEIKITESQARHWKEKSPEKIKSYVFKKFKFKSQADLEKRVSEIYLEKYSDYSTLMTYEQFCERSIPWLFKQILGEEKIKDILKSIIPEEIHNSKPKTFRNIFGYVSYSKSGDFLQSAFEKFMYDLLEVNNIKFFFNKEYPKHFYQNDSDLKYGTKLRYDFYIPCVDNYIECAGNMGDKSYKDKMEYKEKLFGAIILKSNKEVLEYIQNLIRRVK